MTEGRFVAIGTVVEVNQLITPATRVIDLEGRTVVPGFIDGHAHMDREGLKFLLLSLHGVRSIEDILDTIEREVRKKQPGEWIVTMPIGDYPEFGGAPGLLAENMYPTSAHLDRVSPHNPVYIRGAWYYWNGENPIVSIANSLAMEIAGVTRHTPPPHSRIDIKKDAAGEPTGVFEETGRIGTVEYTLMRVVPQFSHEDRVAGLRESMSRYNAAGTTSVYEGHGVAPDVIDAYEELWQLNELTVRTHLVVSPSWGSWSDRSVETALRDMSVSNRSRPFSDDMLRLGGVHIDVRDSASDDVRRKSSSNPGWAGYSVDSVLDPATATLDEVVLAAAMARVRLNAITHDSDLLDEYLDVIERVSAVIDVSDERWVLQHLSFVEEAQLSRLSKLGIHTTIVPGTTIWKHGTSRTSDLDDDEASKYVPLRRFVDHAVPFAFSTDNVPIEPMKSVWAAVTRRDAASGDVVGPGQTLSREEALRAFTVAGAHLSFEETEKGSIEVGKFADFAVLSQDVMTVPEEDIHDIDVVRTVVGGRTVHGEMAELEDHPA